MAKPLPVPVELESSDKWEAQMRKGCLEMAVLATLWHGKLYGLDILRALERDSQLILSEGTVYPILNRLRAEGLLQAQWVEAEAGHPRKYYELTAAGRDRATVMAEMWTEFSAGLGSLIEPLLKSARKASRDNGRSRKEQSL
jgi:PadR family transcriptional regulator PadR